MSDNKVTLDQLDNSAVEAMTSSVGDVSMLNTENKTIVGALAEIVGKKEIANAIGEPLAETDKFTEMSSEINGLLSTFKTNMMNAGVVVESGDKFKALIDKIKGLTEGEGNKGVQFKQGIHKMNNYSDSFGDHSSLELEIDFTPSIILAHGVYNNGTSDQHHHIIYNEFADEPLSHGVAYKTGTSTSSTAFGFNVIKKVEGNIHKLIFSNNTFRATYNWYAIGVGEEDTTLRDSLASILEEEGISVTEEDDMASLISKVDSEFDNNKKDLTNALLDKGVKLEGTESVNDLIQKINTDMSQVIYSGTQHTLAAGETTGYTANYSTAYVSNNLTIPALPTGMIKGFKLRLSVTHTDRMGASTKPTGYIQVYLERNSEIIKYIYDGDGPTSPWNEIATYDYEIIDIQENDKIHYKVKSTSNDDIWTYCITGVEITYNIFEL